MEDVSAFFRRLLRPEQRQPVRWSATWTRTEPLRPGRALLRADPGGDEGDGGPGCRAGRWARRPIVLHDRVELDRSTWSGRPSRIFTTTMRRSCCWPTSWRGARSSRLYRKLVVEEQIAQDVTAYQSGRELAGSFGIVVTLAAVPLRSRRRSAT